jgi:hypothetical protein
MNHRAKSWDGQEPVTDALDRFGYRDSFDVFMAASKPDTAILLLLACGVDDAKAQRIVEGAMYALKSDEN